MRTRTTRIRPGPWQLVLTGLPTLAFAAVFMLVVGLALAGQKPQGPDPSQPFVGLAPHGSTLALEQVP